MNVIIHTVKINVGEHGVPPKFWGKTGIVSEIDSLSGLNRIHMDSGHLVYAQDQEFTVLETKTRPIEGYDEDIEDDPMGEFPINMGEVK